MWKVVKGKGVNFSFFDGEKNLLISITGKFISAKKKRSLDEYEIVLDETSIVNVEKSISRHIGSSWTAARQKMSEIGIILSKCTGGTHKAYHEKGKSPSCVYCRIFLDADPSEVPGMISQEVRLKVKYLADYLKASYDEGDLYTKEEFGIIEELSSVLTGLFADDPELYEFKSVCEMVKQKVTE